MKVAVLKAQRLPATTYLLQESTSVKFFPRTAVLHLSRPRCDTGTNEEEVVGPKANNAESSSASVAGTRHS